MNDRGAVTGGILYRFVLRSITRAVYAETGRSAGPPRGSYDELVGALLFAARRLDAAALVTVGLGVIDRLVPRSVARAIRSLIHNDRIAGKIAVLLVPRAIGWLVGPVGRRMDRTEAVIERCRLLDRTSPAVCLRMCKAPSEAFLAERLNVAIWMQPNIATGRCVLIFGPRANRTARRGAATRFHPGGRRSLARGVRARRARPPDVARPATRTRA